MKSRHAYQYISVILSALLISSCVTTGSNQTLSKAIEKVMPEGGEKQVIQGALEATREWSPAEERQLGQEMSATLLGASALVSNDEAQRYLNQLGMWIALQTDQPLLPWRFGIIDTPNINAFAAPGGYIFITRGLLLRMNNEAELAGVLGHEISHVLKHHHTQAMKKRGAGDIFLGLLKAQSEKSQQSDMSAIHNLTRNLYTSGLDKNDEYEADRMGVVLAYRAGYSAYGLPSVLQMYAGSPQDAGFELLFATHPAPNDRLGELDRLMTGHFDNLDDGITNTPRLEKIQKILSYNTIKEKPANSNTKPKK